MPAALTRLVGRDKELVELRQLLAHTRLLTLVGTGGVGKTRLAIELARVVQDTYSDGVRLVEMTALADGVYVPETVAAAAGVRERPDRPLLDQVAQTLKGQHTLLVLDNCEHVLDACVEVAERILTTCPRVSILATSRERLGLTGETAWRVPSLLFPWPQTTLAIDRAGEYAAVRLFLERASEALPGFAITSAEDARAVAAICFRLDGIPLALELAAARLAVLSLRELAERLDHRFRLLARNRRGGLARHQTLRTSLGWSHDLLSATEQAAFRRLSVFAGSWTLEAAEALLDEGDALDLLARLVDKSLVQGMEHRGATRYAFLESIRAYAAERLADSGEDVEIRERHARYYLAFAEEAQSGLRGPDQARWLVRVEAEHDNLRTACRWFGAERARAALGLRLAAALWEFWQIRGYIEEASGWLKAALKADDLGPSAARAGALCGLGVMTSLRGDQHGAEPLFAESAALFAALGEQVGQVNAVSFWAIDQAMTGDDAAVSRGKQAVALARATGDLWSQACALHGLGFACQVAGETELGLRSCIECAALASAIGDQRARAYALRLLGNFLLDTGQAREALDPLRESIAIFVSLGDVWGVICALAPLIRVEAELGEMEPAARLDGISRMLRERIGAELPPPLQLIQERGVALARDRLGAARFESTVSSGLVLSLEQALAEVAGASSHASAHPSLTTGVALPRLTSREREVVELITEGLTNREIADRLVIAERTADTHVQNILAKLGCATRTQVALRFAPPRKN